MEEDYTLVLPDHVLHHIMSFMSFTDAARVSVLSKRWRQARDTYQNVVFDQRRSKGPLIRMFPKYVDDFLRRRLEHNYDFQKFKLAVSCFINISTADITRWLEIAVKNNVKELSMYMDLEAYHVPYNLPSFVLAAKTLTALTLHWCVFEELDGLNLPNLRELELANMIMTDDTLQKLISSCPSIDFLCLDSCDDLVNLEIPNLEKLTTVDIWYCNGIQKVNILAPKLEFFLFIADKYSQRSVTNLTTCSSLKELILEDQFIDNLSLERLIHNCPHLEILELSCCHSLIRVNISLSRLKSLKLYSCRNLIGGDLHVPQLESFEYIGPYNLLYSLVDSSRLRRAELELLSFDENPGFVPSDEFLSKLHKFLTSFDQSKGFKLVMCHSKLQKTAVFQSWKHLKLPSVMNMKFYIIEPSVKLETLLEQCLVSQPETLSLVADSEWQKKMCEKVNDQVSQKHKLECCAYKIEKCWRHYLKGFSTELSAPQTNDYEDGDELKTWMTSIEAEGLPSTTISLSWDVQPKYIDYYLEEILEFAES